MTRPALPLFVYGTLMSNGPRAGLLGGLTRMHARVRGELYDLPAGYPALKLLPPEDARESFVHGELVAAPADHVLAMLDLYEGVSDGLYRRVVVDALAALRVLSAWTYVMDAPEARGGRRVKTGRWRPIRQR